MTKDEARHLCKTDRMFLGKVLGYDFQPDVHPDMFKALLKNPEHLWRMILWPRGHFKTTAVTCDIIANILNHPDARILTMQATLKLTKGWVHEIASHFSGKNPHSKLLSLFPEFEVASGDALGFTVKARQRVHLKEPTVAAASPKAVNTGQHYSDGYFDDLVNAVNFRNVELLDKLENEFNHYQPLIDPGGFVTVTGTRYSFADLYQRIIKRNKGEWEISIRKCFKEDGSLLFPARPLADGRMIGFTMELLAQLRRDDPETFSAQYLNEILIGAQQNFPEATLLGAVKSTKDNEYPATAPTFFFVDLAESAKAESDHSVIAIGARDNLNRVWLKDCVGGTWTTYQLTAQIIANALIHRPVRILIEKQPGATYFAEYLKEMARQKGVILPVDLVPGSRQKDAKRIRISALETFFKTGRLLLCAGIHDFDRLLEEFTQFPRGRHDDRPDCIALLVGYMTQNTFYTPPTPIISLPFEPRRDPFAPEFEQTDSNPMGDGFVC